MTHPEPDHAEQKPQTVEDLSPRAAESAGIKGGFNPQPDPPGKARPRS
jgi:hypothetical protein